MTEHAPGELTIDELARETGMTVRNIRAHQSRGLLPPPQVRARTGYYGHEHVARLRLIQDMQAEGFNLKAIERLVTASPGGGEQLLDFGRAVLSAFGDEEPELLTRAELE
jgi:DNA-binding transcriptional MerR regulator